MKTVFVDSNVFLRFLTFDDEKQHTKAADLMHKATDGKIALITGPPVLFEIAWTLRAAYQQPQEQILEILQAILNMAGLRVLDAELVENAIDLARKCGQEFADAYICVSAAATDADEIATFNRKHFERLGAALYPL